MYGGFDYCILQQAAHPYPPIEETLEYGPIENFWLNAIENTCYFKVSEEDKKILKFLIKIHSNLIINNEMGDTYESETRC